MAFLNADIQKQVRSAFGALAAPVRLVVFTQGEGGALECHFCAETRTLIEEVAGLSDKITVEVRDFVGDAALAQQYHVDKIPAFAVLQDGPTPTDFGIRFYGIPSGYEFGTLIETIILVSHGKAELKPKTLAELQRLTKPVNIQVYVTPT